MAPQAIALPLGDTYQYYAAITIINGTKSSLSVFFKIDLHLL